MAKQYDLVLRLFCLGDSGVGKTCMICRFAEDTFVERCDKFGTTIGKRVKFNTFASCT